MTAADWPEVRFIYEEGIATNDATFQSEAPRWDEWDRGHVRACRLVAATKDAVAGWAAISAVSSRPVYAGVAEVSVYVRAAERGRGLGRSLLEALVTASERHGIWTLQAVVFPENVSSLALHERCGFRTVGRRERLGQMNGRWRDVLLLERRSPTVGLPLYHITSAPEAEAAKTSGTYLPLAFHRDGFIHCSYKHQLSGVAGRFFGGQEGLVVLEIDRARLTCAVVDENLEGGTELFPHIYGPLPMAAVVAIHDFPPAPT